MVKLKQLLSALKDILLSNRFKAFYWSLGDQALVFGLVYAQELLTNWNPGAIPAVLVGLILTQVTKKLNNIPKL